MDIRNEFLIKTIRLEGVRRVGDPHEFATRYDADGIDELVFLDVVASLYGRNGLADILSRTMSDVFVPVAAGGGVKSVADARALLNAGADKIVVNTAAVERPELLTELALKLGSQSVVLQLDAKRKGDGWEAYTHGGRQPTGWDAIEWAEEAVEKGAGEILVTSIDREGTGRGVEVDIISNMDRVVPVPVVYCGGVAQGKDVVDAAKAGASGVAMAGALHFGRMRLSDARTALTESGVPCRLS